MIWDYAGALKNAQRKVKKCTEKGEKGEEETKNMINMKHNETKREEFYIGQRAGH